MRTRTPQSASSNQDAYRKAFVRRVHQLLSMAYQSMAPVEKWGLKHEEDISGELARLIDETLDELSEPWMRFFSLEPERHVDEPHLPLSKRRLGKRRRRMDFRFRCRQRRPVLRFVYEAKLLQDSGSYQDLLGESGLGRFLDKKYSRDDRFAGLLGFVAVNTTVFHATKVEVELKSSPSRYRMIEGGDWALAKWPALLKLESYKTKHHRPSMADVEIFFTFLRFC